MQPFRVLLFLLILAGVLVAPARIAHGQWDGIALFIEPAGDVTVTGTALLIRAANSRRVSLSCTNHSSTVALRWGDSTVTSAKGMRIPAGASIEIRNRAAIYALSEGASVTVSCTEETR